MRKVAALTPENAQFHCRTCLREVGGDGTSKRKSFSISTDSELQRLIAANVEDVDFSALDALPNYPQSVCRDCYKQLRNFGKFFRKAQQTAQSLSAVFDNSCEVVREGGKFKVQGRRINREDGVSEAQTVNDLTRRPLDACRTVDLQAAKASHHLEDNALQESESVLLLLETDLFMKCRPANESSQDPFTEAVRDTTTPEADANSCANNLLDVEHKTEDFVLETESDVAVKHNSPTIKTNKPTPAKRRQTKSATGKVRRRGAAYRCEQCNRRFVRKYHYDAHVLEVHQGTPRPYACDQCELNYKSHSALCYHKHVAHKLNGTNFPCEACGKAYKTETSLRYHHRVQHLGHKQVKRCICEHCGATFAHATSLVVHIKAKHAKSKHGTDYKCHICNKSFHSPYTLNYHNLREHEQEKPCVCKHCGVAFAKKFMLASHMRSHLSEAEKLPCSYCSKRFVNQKEVDKHVHMVHMKIKPHICTYCGESFGTPKTLRHHVYIHTGEKPYECDVCGQAFRQPTAMKTHRNIHFKKQHVDASK